MENKPTTPARMSSMYGSYSPPCSIPFQADFVEHGVVQPEPKKAVTERSLYYCLDTLLDAVWAGRNDTDSKTLTAKNEAFWGEACLCFEEVRTWCLRSSATISKMRDEIRNLREQNELCELDLRVAKHQLRQAADKPVSKR